MQFIEINIPFVENVNFLVITLYNLLISRNRIQLNGWCNARSSLTFKIWYNEEYLYRVKSLLLVLSGFPIALYTMVKRRSIL